jgi:hypothetical protein
MRKLATATVLLFLLVMAGAPAGANAASKDQAHSDLSSLPKIEAYLASIGIDLGSMVVQQGQLNYAGPNCPGAGWNCTTANKVVQLAPATLPAANIVDCSPAVSVTLLGVDECVIVQSSALSLTETASTLNSASCDIEGSSGSGKQRCKIKQQSKKGGNQAQINQRTNQRGGSPQFAKQEATIEQTSDTGNNTAKITQTIAQDLKTTSTTQVTQQQDACQYAKVSQSSTMGGNSSDVQQSQFQAEEADSSGDIDQFQNTAACQFSDIAVVGERNATADVMQNSTTGNLTSNLRQLIKQDQVADSPAGTVNQTQSNSPSGGVKGEVTQSTTDPGVIRSASTQDETQTQDADTAGTLTQLQEGPEFCCAEQMGGTAANENTVTQSNVQNQTPGSATSDQSTLQEGFCSETVAGATCTVTQTYTANGEGTPQSATGMTVNCSRGGEGDFCFGGVD